MGLTYSKIKLSNPRNPALQPVELDWLVDTGALVLGNETLLGAVPMEDMDLVVHPATQKLMGNPLHPNKPSYTIK